MTVHPIEVESYRILAGRVDLSHLQPGQRAVVERMVHASADVEYAETARFDDGAVEAAVAALRSGAPLVTDVEMVRAGWGKPELAAASCPSFAGDPARLTAIAKIVRAACTPRTAAAQFEYVARNLDVRRFKPAAGRP